MSIITKMSSSSYQRPTFDAAGVSDLQTELQQHTDATLKVIADEIQRDFINWLCLHFNMTRQQVNYLKQLQQLSLSALSTQVALAVASRLPIRLEQAKSQIGIHAEEIFKILSISSQIQMKDRQGDVYINGALIIKIEYKSVPEDISRKD